MPIAARKLRDQAGRRLCNFEQQMLFTAAACMILAVFNSQSCAAQPSAVTVQAFQKLSSSSSFAGTLGDGSYFGRASAAIGDVNNDGVADLAVGASHDADGGTNRGAVWILFMDTDGTVKTQQKISDLQGNFSGRLDNGDNFGTSIAALGDFNGDRVPDIAVGADDDSDGGPDRGALYILYLRADGTVHYDHKISATQGNFAGALNDTDRFGFSIAMLSRNSAVDPPTVTLAVGAAFGDDNGILNCGFVWVITVGADGAVKSRQKISNSQGNFKGSVPAYGHFGNAVAALGDLDGDAVTDLAVGVYNDNDGGGGTGAMWVLVLAADGTVKSQQKIGASAGNFNGFLAAGDRFGSCIAVLHEITQAGTITLAVGAYRDDLRGAIWVLVLNADGIVTNAQRISTGVANFTGVLRTDDHFGLSTATLGRLNNNEVALAVGAPYADDGGQDRGAVWILFLRAPLSGSTTTSLLPTTSSSAGSSTLSSAGSSTATSTTSTLETPVAQPAESSSSAGLVTYLLAAVVVLCCCAMLVAVAVVVWRRRSADLRVELDDIGVADHHIGNVATPAGGTYVALAMPVADTTSPAGGSYGALPVPGDSSLVPLPAQAVGAKYSPLPSPSHTPAAEPLSGAAGSPTYVPLAAADEQRFLIRFEDLRLEQELARGNFGVVYRGEYASNECVVKQLKSQSSEARAELVREAQQLAQLRPHASICAFYGACLDPGKPLCLVTEYIKGGNLGKLLLNPAERVCGRDVVNLARDLAAGMSVLHRSAMLHLDLAARNLLVVISANKPLKLRICDFGLSQTIPKGAASVSAEGCHIPWRWAAPEIMTTRAFDKAYDIWAFGVCVYEMLSRSLPYADLAVDAVYAFVASGNRLPRPDVTSTPQVFATETLVDDLYAHDAALLERTSRGTSGL